VRIQVPAPSAPERRTLAIGERSYDGWFVIAGVPHFVLRVEAPESFNVAELGALLRRHERLGAEGANIDFAGPRESGRYRMRTFERGVEAETLACGSGAIAVAAVLASDGIGSPVVLAPTSGIDLRVDFERTAAGPDGFTLTGEARVVFEGALPTPAAAGGLGA
jgi:diaminopimelate epimerase